MSNPITALRRLMSKTTLVSTGRVLTVAGDTVRVITDKGTVDVTNVKSVDYREGDTVRIQNGLVLGRIKGEEDLPTYHV